MKNQFKNRGRWKDDQINRKLDSKYFEALAKEDEPTAQLYCEVARPSK